MSRFARGLAAALPLVPSTVAWAMAFGAAAVAAGPPTAAAVAMSANVWSGTAQLGALPLLGQPLAAVFLTALLLSLRFVPMGLALGGLLPRHARWQRALAALGLADASFALLAGGSERSLAWIAGTWVAQYGVWVLGTTAGALAAPLLPRDLRGASDTLVAVIFAVLAVSVCARRRETAAAIVAAVAVVLAALVLPSGLALALAAIGAALVVTVLDR